MFLQKLKKILSSFNGARDNHNINNRKTTCGIGVYQKFTRTQILEDTKHSQIVSSVLLPFTNKINKNFKAV